MNLGQLNYYEALVLANLAYKAVLSPFKAVYSATPIQRAKGNERPVKGGLRLPIAAIMQGTNLKLAEVKLALKGLQDKGYIQGHMTKGPMGPEVMWLFYEDALCPFLSVVRDVPKVITPAEPKPQVQKVLGGPKNMRGRGNQGGFAPKLGADEEFDRLWGMLCIIIKRTWGLDASGGRPGNRRNRLWTIHNHFEKEGGAETTDYTIWLSKWIRGTSRGWEDRVLPYAKDFRVYGDTLLHQFFEYCGKLTNISSRVLDLYGELQENTNFRDIEIYGYPSAFDFPVQNIRLALDTFGEEITAERVRKYPGGDLRKWLMANDGASRGRGGWQSDVQASMPTDQRRRLKRDALVRAGTMEGKPDTALDEYYSDPKRGVLRREWQ